MLPRNAATSHGSARHVIELGRRRQFVGNDSYIEIMCYLVFFIITYGN